MLNSTHNLNPVGVDPPYMVIAPRDLDKEMLEKLKLVVIEEEEEEIHTIDWKRKGAATDFDSSKKTKSFGTPMQSTDFGITSEAEAFPIIPSIILDPTDPDDEHRGGIGELLKKLQEAKDQMETLSNKALVEKSFREWDQQAAEKTLKAKDDNLTSVQAKLTKAEKTNKFEPCLTFLPDPEAALAQFHEKNKKVKQMLDERLGPRLSLRED
uniref:Uncharacterized protein n=1 Tax=Cannabis sativa TaxID=3483 RepID=A0A803QDJ3_CANSA